MLPRELLGATVREGHPLAVDEPIVQRDMRRVGARFRADRSRALLSVPGVGEFGVSGGDSVVVRLEPSADEITAGIWLYGTLAAMVLGQQGRMALHATTVDIAGAGVAVSGSTEAGKSTTALELCRRGHRMIADDVSPLVPDDRRSGRPGPVVPFGRPAHVWPRSGADPWSNLGEVRGALPVTGKLVIELEKTGLPSPPLTAIAVIELAPGGPVTSMPVNSVDAVAVVSTHLYRGGIVRALWPEAAFRWAGWVADAVPLWIIKRPSDRWTVAEVADVVEGLAES